MNAEAAEECRLGDMKQKTRGGALAQTPRAGLVSLGVTICHGRAAKPLTFAHHALHLPPHAHDGTNGRVIHSACNTAVGERPELLEHVGDVLLKEHQLTARSGHTRSTQITTLRGLGLQ